MKKLLTLFLILFTVFAKAAEPVDTTFHNVITSRFIYSTKDTSLYVWLGSKWDTLKLAQPGDTIKITDFLTKYQGLKFKLKSDSIIKSGFVPVWRLTHKLDSIMVLLYKKTKVDSLLNAKLDTTKATVAMRAAWTNKVTSITPGSGVLITGTTTVPIASLDTTYSLKKTTAASMYQPLIPKSTGFLTWNGSTWVWDANTYTSAYLPNDTWTKVYDYAGNLQNMWKVSKDNILTPGFKLGISSLYMVADQGKVVIADMPNLRSAANDTLQYSFRIGGVEMLKMRVIANGSGGANDTTIIIPKLRLTNKARNGYYLQIVDALGTVKAVPMNTGWQGTWNATTNTPTLANGTAVPAGYWYRCLTAGTTNFGAGNITFAVGDEAHYNGSIWQNAGGSNVYNLQVATKTVLGGVKIDSVSIKNNGSGQLFVKTDYVENATHTGDATGATALTLATVNDSLGYYNWISANAKGLVTGTQYKPYLLAADIAGKKDISDSLYAAGYTRRDRFLAGLATKEPVITAGTTAQYWRGDKSWQTFPDLTVYKQKSDTVNSTGYLPIWRLSAGLGFTLLNDQWLTAKDYAGNVFNLIKVSKDNMVTVPNLALSSLFFVRNSGVNTIADLPLNTESVTGDYYGFKLNIGGVQALRIAGKWSGTAIDTIKVTAPVFEMTTGAAINKIAMSEDSRGKIKWSDTKYLFSLVANRILYASATNEMGQLPLGTANQPLLSGGVNAAGWASYTLPASATAGKVFIGDGTNIVLSTPTFPNASATFGKVIKSDGTNWIASTETYAAPSTSGNVMLSDGTNWTSSTPTDWNTAYTDRMKWDGGSTGLTAATGRTSLGGTTIGQAMFTLTNPSTVTFLQLNADNSVTAKNAADFRTAIGFNGTGFVKMSGTTVSYDNSTYSTDIHANITALNAVSGTNTGDQDITAMTHTNRAALDAVSGTNTGDNAVNSNYSGLVTNATHTGDATGATALTLATVNSNIGTYNGITVNAKGLVTGATSGNYATGGGTATGTNTGDNATNTQYSGLVSFPGFGTTHVLAAYGDHTHTGVYQPAGTYSTDIHSNITALNAVSGTNTGNQTSIVGITGTIAQFNTALTNAVFATTSDIPTVYDATLTAAVSGFGLSISSAPTFTANASANKTITITSNATATNTASTIVLRDGSGNVSLIGDICTTSDIRLKKNIKKIDWSKLQNLDRINWIQYAKKTESDSVIRYGVKAQELEKILPQFVYTTQDSAKTKSVDYNSLLISKILQMENIIKGLEKRIEKLEDHNKWEARQIQFQ